MSTDKALVSIDEASRLYSVGRTALYEAVKSGALPSLKPHAHYRVAPDDVMAWLRDLSEKRAESE